MDGSGPTAGGTSIRARFKELLYKEVETREAGEALEWIETAARGHKNRICCRLRAMMQPGEASVDKTLLVQVKDELQRACDVWDAVREGRRRVEDVLRQDGGRHDVRVEPAV